ncbi:unnamed protein product [Moneuplotes crassus]|uniref:Uncharacterized protein n=1 Tax=Euplotes crassus TaxID=5936 RepID=A0AAD1Y5G2_EUPCR|nr:unnamed protein product [Moneuplotes crassus]
MEYYIEAQDDEDKKLDYLSKIRQYWEKSNNPNSETLSRYFLWKMMREAEDSNDNIERAVEGKFCPTCGSLYVPTVNAKIKTKTKSGKKRKTVVSIKCLKCKNTHSFIL